MNINAEKSTAQPNAVITVVNKQEAETQILLLSGETVITGVLSMKNMIIK
ncbi:MAG: hypothetical protein WD491_04355 [Balneolales bacterium]